MPANFPACRDGCQIFPGSRFARGSEEAQFENMVRVAQEYIAAGDIYQVCLVACLRGGSFLRMHGHSTKRFDIIRPRPTPHFSILEVRR